MADETIELELALVTKNFEQAIRKAQASGKDFELAFKQTSKGVESSFRTVDKEAKKTGKSVENAFSKGLSSFQVFAANLAANVVANALGALTSAASGLFRAFTTDGVAAAERLQQSIQGLAAALGVTADSAQIQEFNELFSNLEKTTGVSKDVQFEIAALGKSFGASTEDLDKFVQASIELSAAAKINLEEAARRIGRSFSGSIEDVSKFATGLKGLSKDSLAAGEGLDVILNQLGGRAAAELQTFAGSGINVSNAFNSIQEAFGNVVVENPAVIAAFNGVAEIFRSLETVVAANQEQMQTFVQQGIVLVIEGLQAILPALNPVLTGFQVLGNVLQIVGTVIGFQVEQAIIRLKFLGRAFGLLIDLLPTEPIINFANSIKEAFNNALAFIGDLISAIPERFLPDSFKEDFPEFNALAKEALDDTKKNFTDSRDSILRDISDIGNALNNGVVSEATVAAIGARLDRIKQQVAEARQDNTPTDPEQSPTVQAFIREQELLAQLKEEQKIREQDQAAIEADLEAIKQDERLLEIENRLGQEEALRLAAAKRKAKDRESELQAEIALEKKLTVARRKGLVAREKESQEAEKTREANFKSSLGTIATLQSSGNKTLFRIGQAAAVATSIIDGVAAVQKALSAAPPPFNFALAALVGVATAANTAKIASAKPPSFQDGGVVPGQSFTGDRVLARVNSGELILNRRQQANLFSAIDSGNISNGAGTTFIINGDVLTDDDFVERIAERLTDAAENRNVRLGASEVISG